MTTDQDPENAQTNSTPPQPAAVPPQDKPSSGRKFLKITGIVVAVLVVLLILIGIFVPASVPKYSTADLVTETQDKISFSRPKQWKDASNVDTLKKDFGLDVSNASVFGDKIVKDKDGGEDIANALVIFGQASGSSPTDLAIIKDPAFKPAFEEAMNKQLQKDSFKSSTCTSIRDYLINYNYDLNNFPVSVAIKLNCQLSDAAKKQYHADSIEMRMSLVIANNGKTYVYALIATDKSWAKNEPVYLQMLRDFKAQP